MGAGPAARAARDPRAAADLSAAAARLASWGFLADPDLPDRPGPARLLVALRDRPTLRHYDPERIEYWVTEDDRGRARTLRFDSSVPLETGVSWGLIRLVDRLGVSNEYLTFGGDLIADHVGDALIALFTSPAPILRRGGHSQPWDPGADRLGAFFGRLLLAVDVRPGFEGRLAAADPLARYAAFIEDLVSRFRATTDLRDQDPVVWSLLRAEAERLARQHPASWAAGIDLLAAVSQPR
jgi:hypothetical protein